MFFKKFKEKQKIKKAIKMTKQTKANAIRDLKSGVSEKEIEEMFINHYISEKDYCEIKDAILSLKFIITTSDKTIEMLEQKLKEL